MNTSNEAVLAKKDTLQCEFPELSFAYVADAFLERCKVMDLKHQLADRHVSCVKSVPLNLDVDAMWISWIAVDSNGMLEVLVDGSHMFELRLCALGVALAHTFHINLTKMPPADYLPDHLKRFAFVFSHQFAKRWTVFHTLPVFIEHLDFQPSNVPSTIIFKCT